jgi:hypothetical protein
LCGFQRAFCESVAKVFQGTYQLPMGTDTIVSPLYDNLNKTLNMVCIQIIQGSFFPKKKQEYNKISIGVYGRSAQAQTSQVLDICIQYSLLFSAEELLKVCVSSSVQEYAECFLAR